LLYPGYGLQPLDRVPKWEYTSRILYAILLMNRARDRQIEAGHDGGTSVQGWRSRMDLELKGRRALVTGSSSGIGEGIARMLAEEGCAVVVHGRSRERAARVAAEIKAAGTAIGDLSTDEGAAAIHEAARAALGGNIEILINNAGGSSTGNTSKAPIDISVADWVSNYHSNALPAVRLCRLAVPDMVAARFGRIINVSSAVAVQPNNLGSDYSGAKAALNNFTVSLAGSLKGVGVTVNTLSPGIIMVDGLIRMGRKRYGDDNLSIEEITRRLAADNVFALPPAGRLGTPADLARVACVLASPLSGFITGANYRVDGGQIRSVN
jgi:3-oxoacyl-[acyl-carrier protein] reductase